MKMWEFIRLQFTDIFGILKTIFRIAICRAGSSLLVGLGQVVRELVRRHIVDFGRAGFIRELLAADAAFPIFDAASSGRWRIQLHDASGMLGLRNLSCFE